LTLVVQDASQLQPLLLTVPQAARILAMGTTQAWDLVWTEELACVRRGERWVRVPYQACLDWIERNTTPRPLSTVSIQPTKGRKKETSET
jgi:hypothetical protein